jgi:pimeloyl-ACP methyl ester carboxylesterase
VTKDSKSVFLSYASEDSEAAARIAGALTAGGIDVWFDSSELRGGDAWDAAIRQQVRSCALFIPLISRQTGARDEGYFRLEWKLAIDRSHLMSKTRPFLVPVVIDDAPNNDLVPDGFREIHWTKLPNGETPRDFVAHIAMLLDPERRGTANAAPTVRGTGADLSQQVQFVNSRDGTRIAYSTIGRGYPLVNAAHWLGHLEFDLKTPVWRPWMERLSGRYQLTRYDTRGCGLSERSVDTFVLEDLVADLEAVVDAVGLSRFALLGKSQGGAISLAYAARHPERVSHIVLCGAFARGPLKRGAGFTERAAIAGLSKLIALGWGKDNPALRQMFTSLFFPDATGEQMAAFNRIQAEATSAKHAARIFSAMAELDASACLAQISAPTLVLHCRGDSVIPFEEGLYLGAAVPGARFESLESRNHVPLAGEPAFDRAFELLQEFLPSAPDQSLK